MADLERKLESSMRRKDDAALLEERIWKLECELEDTRGKAVQARRKMKSAWNVEKLAWASERALVEQERGKRLGGNDDSGCGRRWRRSARCGKTRLRMRRTKLYSAR